MAFTLPLNSCKLSQMAAFFSSLCFLSVVLFLLTPLYHAYASSFISTANVTLFSGTFHGSFEANATHLTSNISVSGDLSSGIGVASQGSGMIGPIFACYVAPSSPAAAQCADFNSNYGLTTVPTVSQLQNASYVNHSWFATVVTPLSRLGMSTSLPGTITMMFALCTWNSALSQPNRHSNSLRTLSQVTFVANANATEAPSSTVMPTNSTPTAPPSTSPSVAPTEAPSSNVSGYVVDLNLLSGQLLVSIGVYDSLLITNITVFGDFSGTIGFAANGMAGALLSCYAPRSTTAVPLCVDIDGYNHGLRSTAQSYSILQSSRTNSTSAFFCVQSPRSRFSSLSLTSLVRVIYARTAFDLSFKLPTPHSDTIGSDFGAVLVDFVSGTYQDSDVSFDNRSTAYAIVGSILGFALVAAICVSRFLKPKIAPPTMTFLQAGVVGLLVAMVAVVIVFAKSDFDVEDQATYRAFGEATAFILALLLIPTTKHVGLGTVLGSSYERLIFLHPVLGLILLITMTTHMGGMFKSFEDPSDLFQSSTGVLGFLCWIAMLIVILPAIFIRRKSYAVFRVTHCFFVVVLVLGALHYNGLWPMLIPGAALWLLDLCLRIHSIVTSKAYVRELRFDEHGEVTTLRLKVRWNVPCDPGSHAYLIIPSFGLIPHPFSISQCEDETTDDEPGKILTFFIKSHGTRTWTGRLAQYAKRSMMVESLRIFAAGPYGRLQIDLKDFDHIILVSGGIGVTPMLSILHLLAQQVRLQELRNAFPKLTAVTFVWICRNQSIMDHFRETLEELSSVLQSHLKCNIVLYCTSQVGGTSIKQSSASPSQSIHDDILLDVLLLSHDERGADELPMREIYSGKLPLDEAPELRQHSTQHFETHYGSRPEFSTLFSTISAGKVGCYICGPPGMQDDASAAAVIFGFMVHKEVFEL